VSKPYLEPKDWYPTLPTVYLSVCALFTDPDDRVLLLKPNYRPYWQIPGGIIDLGEAPHETVEREVVEELGMKIHARRLLVVDFAPALGDRPKPMMHLLFDGGVITDPDQIRLQHEEHEDYRFFTWAEAETKMPQLTAPRIPAARQARQAGQTIYLPAHL
jgi:8-oxo-dGTP pyrophosphatase MutT (NUDIX family)